MPEDGSEDARNMDLYVLRLGAEQPLRLTTDAHLEEGPAWSPDGHWIAFLRGSARFRQDIANYTVHLIPSEGGPDRHLADVVVGNGTTLTWTPDGRAVVLQLNRAGNEPAGLFAVSVDTGSKRRLTTCAADWSSDNYPAFSPDGRWLAFVRGTGPFGDIFVLPLAGGEPRRIPSDQKWSGGLAWSSDSQEVIVGRSRDGGQRLWRVPLDTRDLPRPVLDADENASYPSVASGHLVYAVERRDVNIWTASLAGVDRIAGEPRRLFSIPRNDLEPRYSPDGTKIAFVSARSGARELWMANSDGTGEVQLTFLGAAVREPRWSPDGASIAFSAYLNWNNDVYVVRTRGARPTRLTYASSMERTPSYSADGRWIYFASDLEGRFEVFRAPVAVPGETSQVTKGGGFSPQESPDGRYLYYLKDARVDGSGSAPDGTEGIWRLRTSSSMARVEGELLTGLPSPILPSAWIATTQGVYVATRPRSASRFQTSIEYYHLENRTLSTVYSEPANVFGIQAVTVTPGALAWAQLDRLESDLRLVKDFK
jgi:Tol biopolymer transport system component